MDIHNDKSILRFLVKGFLLFYLFTFFPLTGSAQSLRFAYLSYDKVMHSMPEYEVAMHNIESLQKQYDEEIRRSEEDFNNKYEEVLEVQQTLAPSIRNKRQVELQDMMNRGIAFKAEAERLLQQAKEDAIKPVRQKLSAELEKFGNSEKYAFIINSDNNTLPFVNVEYGENITEIMISKLR